MNPSFRAKSLSGSSLLFATLALCLKRGTKFRGEPKRRDREKVSEKTWLDAERTEAVAEEPAKPGMLYTYSGYASSRAIEKNFFIRSSTVLHHLNANAAPTVEEAVFLFLFLDSRE